MTTHRWTAILLLGAALPLSAQLTVTSGGGAGHLDHLTPSSLTTITGTFDGQAGPSLLSLSGNSEQHFGLGTTGLASASWHYVADHGGWHAELGPDGEWARDIGAPTVGYAAAHLLLARAVGAFSLQAEWESGRAWIATGARAWYRPTLTARWTAGPIALDASWQSTSNASDSTGGSQIIGDDTIPERSNGEHQVHDVSAGLRWQMARFAFDGRVGQRFGVSLAPEMWWQGEASFRVTPIMSLVARSGRLASSALLGLRGGASTTFGVRLDLVPPRAVRPVALRATEVERETSTTIHVWFALPANAHHVAFRGDLTDWKSVTLDRSGDGRWETLLRAAPGVYRVDIQVDGDAWSPPPGLAVADDGFGSRVGLLVVTP